MAVILVLGATGLLGTALVPTLAAKGHKVVTHGFSSAAQEKADISNFAQTSNLLARIKPDCIINLVALTNVDQCEREPHLAYLLNVATVTNLVKSVQIHTPQCHLVQISTDQVYDGHGPHTEANVTVTNTYAFSKIAAEIAASGPNSTVLRTSFFGRSHCAHRTSFSDWIVNALRNEQPINVFDDILFSALEIKTLALMIERVVSERPIGLFNLGARNGMSKSDFAFAIAEVLGLSTKHITRTVSATCSTLNAYRPKDMRMDSSLFEESLDLRLPTLSEQLDSLRSDYFEKT